MSIGHSGLPPRQSRNKRTKGPLSLKRLIQSGLVLFGTLFFGLIGIELYQAKMSQPAAAGSPVVTTEEPADVQIAPQSEQAASGTATSPVAAEEPTQEKAPQQQGQQATTQTTPQQQGQQTAPQTPAAPQGQTSASAASQPGTKEVNGKTAAVAKPQSDNAAKVTPAAAAGEKPKAIRHVVQKGETLYMLSRKYYGNNSNVARIANYNGLSLEAQLVEGKVVLVPLLQ